MRTETLEVQTENGMSNAYVALPDDANSKAVLIIQEWWGLNDHIKDIARRYADEGFIGIAPDLYRGKVAADPDEASKMMNGLQIEDGLATIRATLATAAETFVLTH